jgi:hypothetical protein
LLFLLAAIIWKFSETVLLIIALVYAITGIVLHVVRFLRHRVAPRAA